MHRLRNAFAAGFALVLVAFLNFIPHQPLTAQGEGCAEPTGMLVDRTYRSAILGQTMTYALYLPPCYNADSQRYPTVYLMHGSDAVDTRYWVGLGVVDALDRGIKTGILPPMLVVLPFGDWIANNNQFNRVSWSTVFLSELMPNVEGNFRADPRRESRAIGGISRGGFWAFNIAFLHPDLFVSLGGHSPFFHPSHWQGANPLVLVNTLPNLETLRIWMDHGREDYAAPNIIEMNRLMEQRKLPHIYQVYAEGKHERKYWASHMMEYLLFYAQPWLPTAEVKETPTVGLPTLPTVTPTPLVALPLARPNLGAGEDAGEAIFLPVIAYKSILDPLPMESLRAARRGDLAPYLALDQTTAAALQARGVMLHPQTPIYPDEILVRELERQPRVWTLLPLTRLTPRLRLLMVDEVNPVYGLIDGTLADYPFAFAPFPREHLTTILISGVTAITRETRQVIEREGVEWAQGGLRGITRRADIFHVSNEVSFHEGCPRFRGGMPFGEFCSNVDHFPILTELGVDVVELSGNHNMDYQQPSYLSTLEMYAGAGIKTVGGGRNGGEARQPFLINGGGGRVAWVSCNDVGPRWAMATELEPGAATCDDGWLREALPRLQRENDVVIISIQWIESETQIPTRRQEAKAQDYADWGADVIIGTQAHLTQFARFLPNARGGESFVHYGLGNLFFDQTFDYKFSYMVEVYVYEGAVRTLALYPVVIEGQGRPRLMDAKSRIHFRSLTLK